MTEQQKSPEFKIAEITLNPERSVLGLSLPKEFNEYLKTCDVAKLQSFFDDLDNLITHTKSTIKVQREQISQSEIVNKDA